MIEDLLKTIPARQIWNIHRTCLNGYYTEFEQSRFKSAASIVSHLKNEIKNIGNKTENVFEDDFYNDCFRICVLANLLESYATYWYEVSNAQFRPSWDTLQYAINYLKTLNKFSSLNRTIIFRFLEKQLLGLEKLYPYRCFLSTEFLDEESVCSICGAPSVSFDCPHIAGELYRGRMARTVIKKSQVLAVGMVKNPVDKKCVVENINGKKLPFTAVEYLQRQLDSVHPLRISHVMEMTQDIFNRTNAIDKTSMCPCGSLKNYENCCLDKDKKTKHSRIILSYTLAFLADDLIELQ